MSILAVQREPLATDAEVCDHSLRLTLVDGRQVSAPLAWFPRLAAATEADRRNWRLIGGGIGVHWPAIDEDISVESLLIPR